jgi:uncharacterized FAD-dependent dehydrogenase
MLNLVIDLDMNFRDLRKCLPKAVSDALKDGFINFERKIQNFSNGNGVITGIETRTSAPVRISRNENLESILQREFISMW